MKMRSENMCKFLGLLALAAILLAASPLPVGSDTVKGPADDNGKV
jgi:hypothetical protein